MVFVRLRVALLVATAALAGGCVVDDIKFAGRPCGSAAPCGGGLVCVASRCVEPGSDGGSSEGGPPDAGDGGVDRGVDDGRVTPPPPPGAHVSATGWGYRSPLPHGGRVLGIWRGKDVVWTVGERGLTARHDANGWRDVPSGVNENITAVWSAGGGERVWACTEAGAILVYVESANRWQPAFSHPQGKPMFAMTGNGPRDIWVAAADGQIVRYSGQWSTVTVGSKTFLGVTVTPSGVVIAVGESGAVAMRSTGGAWSVGDVVGRPELTAVLAVGDELWIGAAGGEVYRVTSARSLTSAKALATAMASPFAKLAPLSVREIAGRGPDDVWVVGHGTNVPVRHFDGTRWRNYSLDKATGAPAVTIDAATVSAGGELWIGGVYGLVLKQNGTSFAVSTNGARNTLRAMHRFANGQLYVAGTGVVALGNQVLVTAAGVVRGAWGIDPSELWLAGSGPALGRLDNGRIVAERSVNASALHAVHGLPDGRAWAVGDGVWTFDGSAWSKQTLGRSGDVWRGVFALDERNVWVVGTAGAIFRFDGTMWKETPSGVTATLNAVWAAAPDLAVAVGDGGTVLRWDGAKWQPVTLNPPPEIKLGSLQWRAVDGSGGNNVWIVGGGGVVASFDGSQWRFNDTGTAVQLYAVDAAAANDVYVAGEGGVLLHYNDR